MDISIEGLTLISHILFIAAICFLTAAVIMFFKFDIRRAYRILKSYAKPVRAKDSPTSGTMALNKNIKVQSAPKPCHPVQADKPDKQMHENTIPLDTIKFMLLQDITYASDDSG